MNAVAVLLASWVALAGDYSDVFAEATASYHAVELRKAAALFRDAAELADDDTERRSAALIWSGVAAGQAGELAIARRAFDEALALSCVEGLPTAVSPKVQDVFQEATRDAGQPRPCPSASASAPTNTTTVTTASSTTTSATTSAVTTQTSETTTSLNTPAVSEANAEDDAAPLPWGTVAVGAGAVFVAAAVGVAVKSLFDIGVAADERTNQVDAAALLAQGNAGLTIASVAGAVGAVGIGVGAALLAIDASPASESPP